MMAIAKEHDVELSLQRIRALRDGALAVRSHIELPYLDMYHGDLDRLEDAGHDVDRYRIPAAWLVSRNVVDAYRGTGHRSHLCVEARFMRPRVDALLSALSGPPTTP
jgi:hypothetical protein